MIRAIVKNVIGTVLILCLSPFMAVMIIVAYIMDTDEHDEDYYGRF